MNKLETLKKCSLWVLLLFVFVPGTVSGQESAAAVKGVDATTPAQILKYYNEWHQSGHADHSLANMINSSAISDPDKTACLVCHTEKGFIEWSKQGFASPNISSSSMLSEPDTTRSPTCMACHDHNAEVSQDEEKPDSMLRLKESPSMLTGGYQAGYMGLGANCMICHTSINGKVNDLTMPRLKESMAPHRSTQGDVVMGENFFFVETPQPTYHLDAIYNTCTGCHMGSTYGGGEPTRHHFRASFQSCGECHYDIDPQSIKYNVMRGVKQLKTSIDKAVTEFIQNGLDAGSFRLQKVNAAGSIDKEYTSFSRGTVSNVSSQYLNGRQAVSVEIDGGLYLSYMDSLEAEGIKLLDSPEGQVIAKAGWNFYMIKNDGSNGAHNPQFISEVLESTQEKITSISLTP